MNIDRGLSKNLKSENNGSQLGFLGLSRAESEIVEMETSLRYGAGSKTLKLHAKEKICLDSNIMLQVCYTTRSNLFYLVFFFPLSFGVEFERKLTLTLDFSTF